MLMFKGEGYSNQCILVDRYSVESVVCRRLSSSVFLYGMYYG